MTDIMQRAIVKMRTLKPLPGEVTDARVREASLPLKIEAARQAIAKCVDLPELLIMKDQAEGLAAAVRIMKTVGPEMVAAANRMCKESILRLGQLLVPYSSQCERRGKRLRRTLGGTDTLGKSQQRQIAEAHGIPEEMRLKSVKIALSPKEARERVLIDDRIPANVTAMARYVPPRRGSENQGKCRHSDVMRKVLNGLDLATGYRGAGGLNTAAAAVRRVDIRMCAQLATDEKKVVRAKVTEIMELLDAIDEACK